MYSAPGLYEATLTVTDDGGASDTAAVQISVTENMPPMASITADVLSGFAPLAVVFSAADSSDSDGIIAQYSWNLGDGATAAGETVQHTYETPGQYTVVLTVTDDAGQTGETAITVSVEESNDAPEISNFTASSTELDNPHDKVTFNADISDPDGDSLSVTLDFGDGEQASSIPASHRYEATGTFEVVLTATDTEGNHNTATVTVVVYDSRPKVPRGLLVNITN
jgi:PKD repeat protein